MARIEKKALPEYFAAVADGSKPFDLRLGDLACSAGDTLVLREWDAATGYTGRSLERQVTCVLCTRDLDWWPAAAVAEHGYVVLGLAPAPANGED